MAISLQFIFPKRNCYKSLTRLCAYHADIVITIFKLITFVDLDE